jgi:hypothetical protein
VEYLGIFLILVAAGLGLVGPHLGKPARQLRNMANVRGILFVPSGPAAFLVAAAGFFIFVSSISSR